jgi:PAS domain S-box-containing protein
MSGPKRVLCVCDDADRRERLATPLQWSAPDITVDTAPGFAAAIEYVENDNVDCVVSDYGTVSGAPAILQAIRERHPDLPMLIVTEYHTSEGSGTAVAEVVDFVDELGQPASDEAFAGWVADSMVRTHTDASPPGGTRPEDIVRDVKQGLVDAKTPMDIEQAVCEELTLSGRYEFAWIGEYDTGERQVVPWVTGAAVDDWGIAETFAVDADTPETLVERVLRSRQTTVVQDIADHPLSIPWEDTAVDNDCTATVLAPLAADDELYGVLGVYTDDPEGVSEMERSAIEEIADTVSNVLHSMALRGRTDQQERVLRRYERLVETVGDGMYALDSDGHFMTVNHGLMAMTGYTREGLLGEHISIVTDDEDVRKGRERIRELLGDDAETTAMEMDVHTKDGRTVPCENQIALLTDDDEEFRGTVGVVRDITERKKREQELQRQNERLEAFAEIVSHDLRNPLSVAQGYLDLAMEQSSTNQLDNVDDALNRMEDIIGDVLALARQGQTVTETEPIDLTATVEEAWSNVSTESATLSVDDLGTVAADRSRLLRLLENLFRNAIEHGGEDVDVRVGSLDEAGPREVGDPDAPDVSDAVEPLRTARFFVADDGRGMSEHMREHAFESDFTTSEEGLGLGLWVVREVASAHGWTVTATESESGGARFEFADVKRPRE